MANRPRLLRIFLDTGVVIDGAARPWGWGTSRAVLTLTTQRDRITVIWAQAVEDELRPSPDTPGRWTPGWGDAGDH